MSTPQDTVPPVCETCGKEMTLATGIDFYCSACPVNWGKFRSPLQIPPSVGNDAEIARLAREYVAAYKAWLKQDGVELTICPKVCALNALIAAVEQEGR